MLPYIVLFTAPMLFQHINFKKGTLNIISDKKKSEQAMIVFWILLFLMLALRHQTIGIDLPKYEYIFDYVAKNNWEKALGRSQEVGWSFINKVIAMLGGNFRTVMVVAALLGTFLTAISYVKYSQDAMLSIIVFLNTSCFILLFSGLRQCIAISFGFLAFEFVRKKKILFFIGVVLLAMLFHTSAFMILFMYPLYHIRIKRVHLLFIVPILALSLWYSQQIFTVLGNLLSSFTDYDTTIEDTGAYMMLVVFAIMALLAFVIPDESKLDADTIGMRSFLLFAVFLQMFASLHSLAMRMNYYYIVFIPIAMSRVIRARSKEMSVIGMIIRHAMIIFFVAYFVTTAPDENALDTFPYRFYWENIYILD